MCRCGRLTSTGFEGSDRPQHAPPRLRLATRSLASGSTDEAVCTLGLRLQTLHDSVLWSARISIFSSTTRSDKGTSHNGHRSSVGWAVRLSRAACRPCQVSAWAGRCCGSASGCLRLYKPEHPRAAEGRAASTESGLEPPPPPFAAIDADIQTLTQVQGVPTDLLMSRAHLQCLTDG